MGSCEWAVGVYSQLSIHYSLLTIHHSPLTNIVMKKILAISGSLRKGSSNHSILRFLGEMTPEGFDYSIYDGLARLPHFDPGLDNENPPFEVADFRALLKEANGVIICTPEYAFGVPGSLKNALDWTVSSGDLVNKPVALITAATGGDKAHASLLLTLGAISALLNDKSTLLLSFIRSKMNEKGAVKDAATLQAIKSVVDTLADTITHST